MTLQNIILALQKFWGDYGCVLVPQYDLEMGAGTFHPETMFRSIGPQPWNCAFIQASRRPSDGRYGDNPNRCQKFYQFQVTLKPSPADVQNLVLESFKILGMDTKNNDIRFIEDNWESPTLGAGGVGWEIQFNGMEILQFTYFQQFAGIKCSPVTVELTYGLERIAMCVQNIWNFYDLKWSDDVTYRELFHRSEKEFSAYNFEHANTEILFKDFENHISECYRLIEEKIILPAYEECIKSSHTFNKLESRGAISVAERYNFINNIRNAASACANAYIHQEI